MTRYLQKVCQQFPSFQVSFIQIPRVLSTIGVFSFLIDFMLEIGDDRTKARFVEHGCKLPNDIIRVRQLIIYVVDNRRVLNKVHFAFECSAAMIVDCIDKFRQLG